MTASDDLATERRENSERRHTEAMSYMSKGFEGLNARLDILNGQTRRNTTDIAVLKDRLYLSAGAIVVMAAAYALALRP
jgi:hypothetical protein